MKKLILLLTFLFSIQTANAQSWRNESRSQPGDDIKTVSKSDTNHNGFYVGLAFGTQDFDKENLQLATLKLAYVANRRLAIGLEGSGVIPTNRINGILDAERVVTFGGFGGLFIEPIIASNEVLHVTFPLAVGAGWMGYHSEELWEEDYCIHEFEDEDAFWYWEPSASAELNLGRSFRLFGNVGYRFVQDFELVNTSPKAMQGLNFSVGFKVGRF